jgi:arylsulfatase A-like enzyme
VIGMVFKRLKELGLYDEMLIAFISDHGEMNGRRATVDKGVYLHPDTLRVPFIIKPPNAMPRLHSTIESPVSLLDLSQTLLDFAGIVPEAKFDGTSLVSCLRDGKGDEDRTLLFFGGWHVGVNFACGVQRRTSDGHRYLYAYNCTSTFDELYDLDSIDAVNLIDSPVHQHIRKELINLLGSTLQTDPRWAGYWSEFRIARFKELPEAVGDMQLFTTSA